MTIFRRDLTEYVAFCKPFLILIFITGAARLAMSLGGIPNDSAQWVSTTAIAWIGVLYYSVRVHTSGFGSYKQLLVICALLNLVGQVIAIAAIVLAIVTGTNNIYSAPEYAFGADGRTWLHAGAHVLIGIPAGSLVAWAIGSLILFATRKFTGIRTRTKLILTKEVK
jgi:hypothetical protein